MKPETKRWLEIANSDYDTGLYLFKGARHPQAVYFLCQSTTATRPLSGYFPTVV